MMHMQGNQGQYLPSIDQAGSGGLQQKPFKSKNVKPDYYKNRRKANFSNMFEVFDDDTQAGIHMTQTQDYDSTVDAKRSMESDDNRTRLERRQHGGCPIPLLFGSQLGDIRCEAANPLRVRPFLR